MPRVLSYTPAWLGHGSPGSAMFAPPPKKESEGKRPERNARERSGSADTSKSSTTLEKTSTGSAAGQSKTGIAPPIPGARRTVAQRGTEVFVAVGNSIRWADFAMLKDNWEGENTRSRGRQNELEEDEPIEGMGFKVCSHKSRDRCTD
jgi:nucleoporin NUP82